MRSLWDFVVFKQAREALGGQVRLVLQGAAPMDPKVCEFFQTFLSCHTSTVYGMTEIWIVQTTDPFNLALTFSVGTPTHCAEMRLADVPDMNYVTSSNVCLSTL